MPNTREKLIELLEQQDDVCVKGKSCSECDYENLYKCYLYAKADHLIANGATVQEWVSVKDRLPEKYGKYLCRYVFNESAEYPHIEAISYYPKMTRFQGEGSCGMRVTHWMPLPEPPKGE